MRIIFRSLLASVFMLSTFAFAQDDQVGAFSDEVVEVAPLLEILSEPQDDLIHSFSLGLNEDGKIVEVYRETIDEEQTIKGTDLLENEILLARSAGRDAVFISCFGCDLNVGGTLVVRYLSNGITNSYENFNLEIANVDGTWQSFTQASPGKDAEEVLNLRLISRKIFGQVIGIREISVNSY